MAIKGSDSATVRARLMFASVFVSVCVSVFVSPVTAESSTAGQSTPTSSEAATIEAMTVSDETVVITETADMSNTTDMSDMSNTTDTSDMSNTTDISDMSDTTEMQTAKETNKPTTGNPTTSLSMTTTTPDLSNETAPEYTSTTEIGTESITETLSTTEEIRSTTSQHSTAIGTSANPGQSTTYSTEESGSSSLGGALAGIIIVILLILAGIAVMIFKVRKGKFPWELYPICKRSRDGAEGEEMLIGTLFLTEVEIAKLESLVEKELENETPFKEEYEKLYAADVKRCQIATQSQNVIKNRYTDVLPYDETLVVLATGADEPPDSYINANFIANLKGTNNRAYIACQGPLVRGPVNTIAAFWRMIWQYNVEVVIMLTSLVEIDSFGREMVKCSLYWPTTGSGRYGRITVILEEEKKYYDFTVRKFLISLDHSAKSRRITQFHYTRWRDFSTAPNSGPLLRMRRIIRQETKGKTTPQIVHCSAGVGRTGTYIAIDQLIEEAEKRSSIDIFQYASRMRRDRMRMIQTWQQYAFVYTTLSEYFLTGNTHLSRDQILQWDKERGETQEIQKQFKVLEKLKAKMSGREYVTASATLNKNKNRFSDVLPDDSHLIHFPTDKPGQSPYINAVQLENHLGGLGYFATQIPLADTVEEFWRLVIEFNCSAIVCLQDAPDGAKWMPTWEEPMNISDKYHVLCASECKQGSIAVKDITVEIPVQSAIHENKGFRAETETESETETECKQGSIAGKETTVEIPVQSAIHENKGFRAETETESETETEESVEESEPAKCDSEEQSSGSCVRLYKLRGYDTTTVRDGGAPTERDVYDIMTSVKSWQTTAHGHPGPVVVSCLNGATVSGVYIASSILYDQLLSEDEADVFQTVKLLSITRPQFINSLEQYNFLHEILAYCAKQTNEPSAGKTGAA